MEQFTSDLLSAGAVILIAILLRIFVMFAIRRTKRFLLSRPPALRFTDDLRHEQRVRTLGSLLRSVADVVIVVITVLTVLAIYRIPMAPLLASAGIGGVAIGFGAQSLVKDYLSGIFMLVEDQFGVGDLVTIDGITGTVEEVTLRVTKVREASGTLWYLRNGEVLKLGNMSQGETSVILDVPIAADEDPDRALEVLREEFRGMHEEEEFAGALRQPVNVMGIGAVDGSKMNIQVNLKTEPNQQWAPMRAVRKRAQSALARAGVRGPILPGIPKQD